MKITKIRVDGGITPEMQDIILAYMQKNGISQVSKAIRGILLDYQNKQDDHLELTVKLFRMSKDYNSLKIKHHSLVAGLTLWKAGEQKVHDMLELMEKEHFDESNNDGNDNGSNPEETDSKES